MSRPTQSTSSPRFDQKEMDLTPKKSRSLFFYQEQTDPIAKVNSSPRFDPKNTDTIPKITGSFMFDKEKMDPIPKNCSSLRFDRNKMDPIPKKTSSASNPKKLEPDPKNTSTLFFDQENADSTPKDINNTSSVPDSAVIKECLRTISNSETTMATKSTSTSDAKTSDSCTSIGRGSSGSSHSEGPETGSVTGSGISGGGGAPLKPHTGGDGRWEAIQLAKSRESPLTLSHFRLLKRLGYGDIGSVYLVELRGTNVFFAMKVMDKASLASRNKLVRAQTERDILGLLDHPFLPTLYSHFETDKFYCLVMEFCCGGNLHSLRQKQPNKYFSEQAARFFASEVLLALEYLHMLGIVYRDLKPENVLVREEGHIMLSDFDLSMQCSVNPTLVKSSSLHDSIGGPPGMLDADDAPPGCIQPSSFFPRILPKKTRKSKSDSGPFTGGALPELMAEPTNARSMSFVGTHEYLAPEIIRGEGHGSAVDWWTFGIFLYELLLGTTPFRGSGNRATLFNVVGQPLRFPDAPVVSLTARDLIRGLLIKDPHRRLAYRRGATEIKQHPFFEGVNWALVRSTTPPHMPEPPDFGQFASKEVPQSEKMVGGGGGNKSSAPDSSYLDFEYF